MLQFRLMHGSNNLIMFWIDPFVFRAPCGGCLCLLLLSFYWLLNLHIAAHHVLVIILCGNPMYFDCFLPRKISRIRMSLLYNSTSAVSHKYQRWFWCTFYFSIILKILLCGNVFKYLRRMEVDLEPCRLSEINLKIK